jgi:ribosome maturation factor RimP
MVRSVSVVSGRRTTPAFEDAAPRHSEAGIEPAFFVAEHHPMTTSIQDTVEARLRDAAPAVEVLLAEVVSGGTLRVVIDHPDGVTLDLCAEVTHHLGELREQYAIEVSSPGTERPLVKPEHFRRYVGRRVRVRTREPLDGVGTRPRRSFTGELVGADDVAVTLAADDGMVTVPYAGIHRSNLIEE